MGNIGVGRAASCLLFRLVRRGCTGVANAGEDEGIACGASLNGVLATGLFGTEVIAISPCSKRSANSLRFTRQESQTRLFNLALQGGAFHGFTMDVFDA